MREKSESSKLAVLWSSSDRQIALSMAFMYSINAKKKGWFDEVTLIVWGPSAKFLSEDKELQDYVEKMIEAGVKVIACKACADMYGAAEKLSELGADVFYVGEAFTKILQSDHKLICV